MILDTSCSENGQNKKIASRFKKEKNGSHCVTGTKSVALVYLTEDQEQLEEKASK